MLALLLSQTTPSALDGTLRSALKVERPGPVEDGPLTQIGGMMHCDSEADGPYRILLLLGERSSGKDKYYWKLEGSADTVDDWVEEFKARLGP